MKRILFLLALAAVSCVSGPTAPAPDDPAKEARMEWFSQAKLGIFIHWGI